MASSSKLALVSTFRRLVLIGSYVVTIATATVAALIIYGAINNEKELAKGLLRSSIRSSGVYFDQRNFRGFVESITNSKDFVFFSISSKDFNQEIGKKNLISVCANEYVFDVELNLCRNLDKSAQYIFLTLLICSIFGLIFIFLLRAMEGAIVADLKLVIGNLGDTKVTLKTLDSSMKSLKYLSENYKISVQQKIAFAKVESKLSFQKQIVHDLKSPIMALEIINKSNKITDSSVKSMMIQAVERLNLLAGKIKDDVSTISKEKFYISELNLVLQNGYNLILHSGADCVVSSLPESLVFGDQIEVARILDNLIKNSIESIKTQSKAKSYCNIIHESNSIYEVISISDSGPGFSKEVVKLLDANIPATSKADGEGVGILGARAYLRLNQGELRIVSSTQGAVVSIYLKRVES